MVTWLSRSGLDAERRTPGSSADSVVWADVTQRAYEESELNWTYVTFMTLATLIASIAIVLDSQILVIGAMVLGPEFVAISALGLALVRRRWSLLWFASRTLVAGFAVAIALTTSAALAARGLGWVTLAQVTAPRLDTAFIYTPDRWSFIVAVIAGAAGVLSLTSARSGACPGSSSRLTTRPRRGHPRARPRGRPRPVRDRGSLAARVNITSMVAAGRGPPGPPAVGVVAHRPGSATARTPVRPARS